MPLHKVLTVSFLLTSFASLAAEAQTVMTGQTTSGAFYRIEVPDGWQPSNGLAIWNHGFDLDPIGEVGPGDLGPLAAVQLTQGYAVAASSYSLVGWALFQTLQDNREMVAEFEAEFGIPDQVLITGASLGGIVTAQAIEQGGLGQVVGAFPFCGAVGGSRVWDGALDLRLIYDVVCGDVPGAAIPGGAGGLPNPPDPDFGQFELGLAVEICTGVVTPLPPTPAQQARLDQLLAVTGLPEEFLLTDMGFATFALNDLVFDPAKLDGGVAMENATVDYGDATINAAIERVAADPAARAQLRDNYSPSGDVGTVKIVSIHTDKDGLVIVENESEYASVVPPQNLTVAIVAEDTPSHCGFTEAEVLAGWESLRAWVGGAAQPTASSIQSSCEDLVTAGTATGPCRVDPTFVIPDMDERIRPRDFIFGDGFESGDTSAWG